MADAKNYKGIFRNVVLLVGRDCAEKLVAKYGGTRLYIPSTFGPGNALPLLLGDEAAQRLSAEFRGNTIEIPRGWLSDLRKRNAAILGDRETGMTQRQLAIKYRITQRTIRKIINGA